MDIKSVRESEAGGIIVTFTQNERTLNYHVQDGAQDETSQLLLAAAKDFDVLSASEFNELQAEEARAAKSQSDTLRLDSLNSRLAEFNVQISSLDDATDAKAFLSFKRAQKFEAQFATQP